MDPSLTSSNFRFFFIMLILGSNHLLGTTLPHGTLLSIEIHGEVSREHSLGIIGGIVAALILGGTFVAILSTRHPFRRSQGCRVHRGIPPGLLFLNNLGRLSLQFESVQEPSNSSSVTTLPSSNRLSSPPSARAFWLLARQPGSLQLSWPVDVGVPLVP